MKLTSEGGFLITKIHHLSSKIFSKKLEEHEIEIGPGLGRVIFALLQEDGTPISDLADRTALGKSTLTDSLDRLADAGLIIRERHPTDRRSILVYLTEKARNLNEEYIKVSQEMTDLFYGGFSQEEIRIFERYLARLLSNLSYAIEG